MKIAFICYECPPDTPAGGIATYLLQAANMLQNRGHTVEIFTASPYRSGVETQANGLAIHRTKTATREEFSDKVAPVFAERHKAVTFDVLEGPDYRAEATGAIRLVPDIPFVVKLHTPCCVLRQQRASEKTGFKAKFRDMLGAVNQRINPNSIETLEQRQALKADIISSPSKAIGERLQRYWKLEVQKIRYFPYPYDAPTNLLKIPIKERDSKVITFVGRLEFRKGVLDLAQAIPTVIEHFPDAKFILVGKSQQSPSPKQKMKEYIESELQQYQNSIEFTGTIPNDQLHTVLSQTDICVFPSLFDSFGLVCLEAMAAGRAVIGSSSGGMAEIINSDAVGRLVPPQEPRQIAQKAIELLGNPELRVKIGMAARDRVLRDYSTNHVGDLQEEAYRQAIKNRRRSVSQ